MMQNKAYRFDEDGDFNDKESVATYTKKDIPLTAYDIDSIIVTALEGGINYWGHVKRTELFQDKPSTVPVSTWVVQCLLDGKTVELEDRDEDIDENMTLTLDKLVRGVEQNCKERPFDCDLDNADANTADAIIQYAVFGKIVFG